MCVYIYKRNEKYRASKLYTMMIFLSFGAPHTLTHIHHIHQAQFRQFLDMYRFFFFSIAYCSTYRYVFILLYLETPLSFATRHFTTVTAHHCRISNTLLHATSGDVVRQKKETISRIVDYI